MRTRWKKWRTDGLTIREPLKHVTYIQNASARNRFGGNKGALIVRIFELQTTSVVLEYKRKGAPVLVGRHPSNHLLRQLLSFDRRIVKKAQLVVVSGMELQELIFLLLTKVQTERYCLENPFGSLV